MLEDIAISTGANAIFKDLGIKLEDIDISDLSKVKKVTIDADNTTIERGAGSTDAVKGRISQIRKEIDYNI